MSQLTPLQAKANKTIRTLRKSGLLDDTHALTIELLTTLCGAIATAGSGAMIAALSKEIRACLDSLPRPEPETTDDTDAFLASLAEDA